MKHTPGKWKYDVSCKYWRKPVVRMNGQIIASIEKTITHSEGEATGNGTLIAAAPELLEALKAVMDDNADRCGNHEDVCVYCQARYAIAKATMY